MKLTVAAVGMVAFVFSVMPVSVFAIFEIVPCVSNWFDGVPLSLTCVLKSGPVDSYVALVTTLTKVQCNSTFDNCFSYDTQLYSVVGVPSVSMTMLIRSFKKGLDDTEWKCIDGNPTSSPVSCHIALSEKYVVIDENLTTLERITLPFRVSVTGNCTYLLPNCTWKYKIKGESEERVPDDLTAITSTNASCNPGDQQATCTLKFDSDSVPAGFTGQTASLHVFITHASLIGSQLHLDSPEVFFSVALTSVSMSTKPAMIEAGVATVLQCITNPAFPTATIRWILDNTTITQGVTSTTERVPGSGFISTSNLTKTYVSKDDGKMLVCSATNGEYTVSSPALQLSITGALTSVSMSTKPSTIRQGSQLYCDV
ncbi:uncharacterized protein LOC121386937 [Gigantopelta aegis]|uniref:uncharacterized protein LOC121386937 n=1 Tax=Gigantopelta aegis TaxID=1735272 RepID=UPI001B88DDB4|nr:uncharacterized protein LOC121386937 [Gigantopelta aegis]